MREGYVTVPGGRVWYQQVGADTGIPLLVLHGGPGFPHNSLLPLSILGNERPVIFYDQLGVGKSDHPQDPSLWQLDRFVDELARVIQTLQLDNVHILGHSWGTMLAASYLLCQPAGVKSVIFSSPCLSAPLWAKDQDAYRQLLPETTQAVLRQCEAEGTTDSDAYQAGMKEYYSRHLCRIDPLPEDPKNPTPPPNLEVYHTMWGPSEFFATGNLKDFDCTGRLPELNLPSLFLCGAYDEATPETTRYYSSLMPNAAFHVFENSAHKAYLEEPDAYIRVVRDFLDYIPE